MKKILMFGLVALLLVPAVLAATKVFWDDYSLIDKDGHGKRFNITEDIFDPSYVEQKNTTSKTVNFYLDNCFAIPGGDGTLVVHHAEAHLNYTSTLPAGLFGNIDGYYPVITRYGHSGGSAECPAEYTCKEKTKDLKCPKGYSCYWTKDKFTKNPFADKTSVTLGSCEKI